MINDKKISSIIEQPISDDKDDCFDFKLRTVNKIYDFISDKSIDKITIAITGEWGLGKSSAINLLRKKLAEDKKNLIVNFEPLVEGKLEIADIIALFYLKLYKQLSTNSKFKAVIKNCLKSIAILSRAKFTGDIGLTGIGEISLEYNLGNNIDALLDLWEKEIPKDLSDQTQELNKKLVDNKFRLCIFIDEIDRLPANYIINFLLFCRILESFNNLACIIGIDYEQIIHKLQKESLLFYNDYTHAQSYLDKLFQIKYQIHHNRDRKISYAITELRNLDCDKILDEIINSDYKTKAKLESIIDYLSTPRQIKKWLIALKANYSIIKYSSFHKLDVIAFIAATIKHPILTDYLSKHALRILNEKEYLPYFLNDQYGVNFPNLKEDEHYKIIAASMGIISQLEKSNSLFQQSIEKLTGKLKIQIIDDAQAAKYVINYLKNPAYLILLFVEGFADNKRASLYVNFFGKKIDEVLQRLAEKDQSMDILASDLAEALSQKAIRPSKAPTLRWLNNLWSAKIDDKNFSNPYNTIILFSSFKIPIEIIISDSWLALSEAILVFIFDICGFENKNGKYNLDDIDDIKATEHEISLKGMQDVKFNNVNIKDFNKTTIEEIIFLWIRKVESDLESKNKDAYNQVNLMSVFYRYVQWNLSVGCDARSKLANFVIAYLKDRSVTNSEKKYLKEIIKHEKDKFDSKIWSIKTDPMEILFDNNTELLSNIK